MANLAVDILANKEGATGVKTNENVILLEAKLIMRDTA
jgi:hypothetical protein